MACPGTGSPETLPDQSSVLSVDRSVLSVDQLCRRYFVEL